MRIEDLDKPRNQPGAIDNILKTLEYMGLYWDDEVLIQSERKDIYLDILEHMKSRNLLFPCICPRSKTRGAPYPGTCRNGVRAGNRSTALRIRTIDEIVSFKDKIQGEFQQNLEKDVGDFVLHRSDGLIAYHLAVVVDDEVQGISEIVRGSDLLDSTPRQIYLQDLLGYKTPGYAHLPVAINNEGMKISKQNHAPAIKIEDGVPVLIKALEFLNQHPDPLLKNASTIDIVKWGIDHWDINKVPARHSIQIEE